MKLSGGLASSVLPVSRKWRPCQDLSISSSSWPLELSPKKLAYRSRSTPSGFANSAPKLLVGQGPEVAHHAHGTGLIG
jgi:hypothetical protein